MAKKLKKLLKQVKVNENTISLVLGSIVLVVVGILIYNYFTSLNQGEITSGIDDQIQVSPTPGKVQVVEEGGKKFAKGLPTTYKVEKGDHLWSIAESYYASGYNWVDIAKANNLKNGNSIEIGQELIIPKVELKLATIKETAKPLSIEGTSYTTVKGDHLWSIAVRAYGDGYAWTKIYNANKDKIGTNPNLLEKDVVLSLPR